MHQAIRSKKKKQQQTKIWGNSLAVQWLGLYAVTAESPGSVTFGEPRFPQATWHGQKKKNCKTSEVAMSLKDRGQQ